MLFSLLIIVFAVIFILGFIATVWDLSGVLADKIVESKHPKPTIQYNKVMIITDKSGWEQFKDKYVVED